MASALAGKATQRRTGRRHPSSSLMQNPKLAKSSSRQLVTPQLLSAWWLTHQLLLLPGGHFSSCTACIAIPVRTSVEIKKSTIPPRDNCGLFCMYRPLLSLQVEDSMMDVYDFVYEEVRRNTSSFRRHELTAIHEAVSCLLPAGKNLALGHLPEGFGRLGLTPVLCLVNAAMLFFLKNSVLQPAVESAPPFLFFLSQIRPTILPTGTKGHLFEHHCGARSTKLLACSCHSIFCLSRHCDLLTVCGTRLWICAWSSIQEEAGIPHSPAVVFASGYSYLSSSLCLRRTGGYTASYRTGDCYQAPKNHCLGCCWSL